MQYERVILDIGKTINIIINILILLFCAYSIYFIIGSTLYPIFAKSGMYYFADKLYFTFSKCCHQQPERSFWLLEYPIAICTRCYGFYIGVFTCGIIRFFRKLKPGIKYFSVILAVILCDILLNLSGINTGNFIRFIIGILMGGMFICILAQGNRN